MLSHCTLSKDKVPGEAHVPSESGLGKQHMPVQKGLVSTTGSLLVSNSSQVSENVTANADMLGDNYQGRQHAEEQNGSCLLPDLPFISEKRSQYASADADIPHRNNCHSANTENSEEKHKGEGAPSDVPVHSISRKRKRKPVSTGGFLLTNFSRSKSGQYINSLDDVHAQAGVIGTTSVDNQEMITASNTESNQVSSLNICADLILFPNPSCRDSVACEGSVKDSNHESSAETVNFDPYINSLEDLLAQPVVPGSTSVDSTEDFNLEKETAEARAKLSSFFAIDFSVFVSSGMHSELENVLGVLSKDPNLTTDQLVQLKLLEVIPLLRTRYLKEAIAIEEANNFFEDLSNKVAKAHSCKDEYNDFKAKEEHIMEEIDSNSLHLTKIKERIAFLLLQRDEVADTISALKVQRNSLNSQNKDIVEVFLPDIVSRIQMANSKKVEWESKKVKALERQAELNAVFISIKEKTT